MIPNMQRLDVVWDTDIGRDPDDFLAGCFLLSRPEVHLRALTISPGDTDQIALAKFLLQETGHGDVPVGAVPDREQEGKTSVKGCQLRIMELYGVPTQRPADGPGWSVLAKAIATHPHAVLFTSGPLNNVGDLLRKTTEEIDLAVSMAGYWAAPGEPESKPEFNLNGCKWAASEFVASKRLRKKLLVGKNVTHQVLYDDDLHRQLQLAGAGNRPLALAHELMALRPDRTKKLHDPLAAAAMLREDLFEWQEVMPVKLKNNWASISCAGSGTWAATSVDISAFRQLFVAKT
jgi:inosine-uridine nucleoside N-ribohydrolase